MKLYYEHAGITIYHGDCREILTGVPCSDLMITDPPYGMEFVSNYRKIKYSEIIGDESFPIDLIEKSISSARCASYVFCRWNNLSQLPKPTSVLAWVKNNWSMGDLKHEHGRQWEAIAFWPHQQHEFIKRIPDVLFAERTGNILHPTEKPLHLIKQIIECNKGDVIFDPFMGSGTTLRAAKELHRRAIGIEIEEKYCEIAANRMGQEVLDL